MAVEDKNHFHFMFSASELGQVPTSEKSSRRTTYTSMPDNTVEMFPQEHQNQSVYKAQAELVVLMSQGLKNGFEPGSSLDRTRASLVRMVEEDGNLFAAHVLEKAFALARLRGK